MKLVRFVYLSLWNIELTYESLILHSFKNLNALNTGLSYLYYYSMILSRDTFCYCLVDSSVSIVFNRPKISQKKRPLILHEQFSCCADMDNIVYQGLQNSKYNKKSKWIWFSSITKLFLIKIERDRPLIVLHMAIV